MSFFSCIGKRSKKKKHIRNEPTDRRLSEIFESGKEDRDDNTVSMDKVANAGDILKNVNNFNTDEVEKAGDILKDVNTHDVPRGPGMRTSSDIPNGTAIVMLSSPKHNKTNLEDQLQQLESENEKLKRDLGASAVQNDMHKAQLKQNEISIASYRKEIQTLETCNLDLKTRVTRAETEAAKSAIDNQKLLQKIIGLEEKQAMMSRAELQAIFAQLDKAESRNSIKSVSVMSEKCQASVEHVTRRTLTQEDRQLSWRLTKAEARLSQSEDENKQLREDLKDMLDSHTSLQQQIVTAAGDHILDGKFETWPRTYKDSITKKVKCIPSDAHTNDESSHVVTELLELLEKAEQDHTSLMRDYNDLKRTCDNLETHLKCLETAREESVREPCQNLRSSMELLVRIKDQEAEQAKFKCEMENAERFCSLLDARVSKLYQSNDQIKSENDTVLMQNRSLKNDVEKMKNHIENLQNELNKAKTENIRLIEENNKLTQVQIPQDVTDEQEAIIKHLEQELSDLKQKFDETSGRLLEIQRTPQATPITCEGMEVVSSSQSPDMNTLSPVMSFDLNSASPAEIVDLKTVSPSKCQNLETALPTLLAERFRFAIYEQQWKHAFSEMTTKLRKDEKRTLQILGEICTEAYLFCKRSARVQLDTITSSLLTPTNNHCRTGQFGKRNGYHRFPDENLPEDVRQSLHNFRTRPSSDMLVAGITDFLNQIDYERTRFLRQVSERELHDIMSYVSNCFDISWRMAVQEPPMYLLFKAKHGLDVDTRFFDLYQSRGQRVDFVVWPAVFTEEGGECLQKGIIYALPERVVNTQTK